MKFKNYNNKFRGPAAIYSDFEASNIISEPPKEDKKKETSISVVGGL